MLFFRVIALLMCAIVAMFAMHVEPEHVFAAAMIPFVAAVGIAVLSSN